jgi:3'(2'), 5'-bisphosphate nucleotidase
MSGMNVTPDALQRLCVIAREAGRAILAQAPTGVPCREKADRSPVTAADLAAERAIVDGLRAWDPAIPIVTEESSAPPAQDRASWERWWLVDPLDGTKEFLANNGEFTVNIALMVDGEPVLGVVFAPALDLLYCAGRSVGSWRLAGASAPVRLRSSGWQPDLPARVVESRSHPSAALEAYLRSIRVSERIRLGSSLKFCRVAEGSADLYPRFGRTMEWDVAAGDCVFRHSAASGERQSPIRYNTDDLAVPGFILGNDDTAGVKALVAATSAGG